MIRQNEENLNSENRFFQTTINSQQKQTTITNLINIDDEIRNKYNHIRRQLVKTVFNQGLLDLNQIVDVYDEWRNDEEYIILRGIKQHNQFTLSGNVLTYLDNYIYRFVKASKRGNDVYRYLIKEKFKQLDDINNIEFFKDNFTRKKTKMLFITLTYDTKTSSPLKSWYNIPKLFNRFKANLTKQYGDIKVFRVWESTNRFYAHIHCLIYFKNNEFEVFKHINKNNQVTYRIPYHQVTKIKEYYPYSIDIQACENFQKALKEIIKYVGKYLIKDAEENKPTKTNAMIWFTRKQGYSISKDFFKTIIGENLTVEEPGAADLTSIMCNSNYDVENWEYVGLISAKELGINGKIWVLECEKPPPLALEKINLLIQEKLLNGY